MARFRGVELRMQEPGYGDKIRGNIQIKDSFIFDYSQNGPNIHRPENEKVKRFSNFSKQFQKFRRLTVTGGGLVFIACVFKKGILVVVGQRRKSVHFLAITRWVSLERETKSLIRSPFLLFFCRSRSFSQAQWVSTSAPNFKNQRKRFGCVRSGSRELL